MPVMATVSTPPPRKAQFYVIRGDGKFVPLVAMDELPNNINIRGVPRSLMADETAGITSVGQYDSRHTLYQVDLADVQFKRNLDLPQDAKSVSDNNVDTSSKDDIDNKSAANSATSRTLSSSKYAAILPRQDSKSEQGAVAVSEPTVLPWRPSQIHAQSTSRPQTPTIDQVRPVTPSINATPPSLNASPILSNASMMPSGKKYCSFWIRNGECDFAQQGCKYKHEMPENPAELAECGLREIPRWYRELYGVRSILAVKDSDASRPREFRTGLYDSSWRKFQQSSSQSSSPTSSKAKSGFNTNQNHNKKANKHNKHNKSGNRGSGGESKGLDGKVKQISLNNVTKGQQNKAYEQANIERGDRLRTAQFDYYASKDARHAAQMEAFKERSSMMPPYSLNTRPVAPATPAYPLDSAGNYVTDSSDAKSITTPGTTPPTSDGEVDVTTDEDTPKSNKSNNSTPRAIGQVSNETGNSRSGNGNSNNGSSTQVNSPSGIRRMVDVEADESSPNTVVESIARGQYDNVGSLLDGDDSSWEPAARQTGGFYNSHD